VAGALLGLLISARHDSRVTSAADSMTDVESP
jgi:hypothetical protein